MKFEE